MSKISYPDERYDWYELPSADAVKIAVMQEQQLLPLHVEGKKICVAKTAEAWYGIADRCPHAGTPLHMGFCNKKGVVVCPTHHYKFSMQTGLSADGNHYKLPTFPVSLHEGKVWIGVRKAV